MMKALFTISAILLGVPSVMAQLDFERAPIHYGEAKSRDAAAQLMRQLQSGEVGLEYDARFGWLPDLLKHLDIPVESQVLVFSKTSLQLHRIGPREPRAIYFNDDSYVGYCQSGEVLEIAATDSELGAVFYTIDQTQKTASILADRGQCLACHATNRTQGVPGYLVRSVFPDVHGRPRSGSRSTVSDHTSIFDNRFGGWYVTGSHGTMRHMGNTIAMDSSDPEKLDVDSGANVSDLSAHFDSDSYLSLHSDIVALMVLEHQSQMHNLIARASMETRGAYYHDEGINEALGRDAGTVSDSTRRRMARAAEDLIRYLLFIDESPLTSPIQGSPEFVRVFQARALDRKQVDSKGRSLREFDLENRLFKYPCSYLIYSDAFQGLPTPMLELVRSRLVEILSAEQPVPGYERLSDRDRSNILDILRETLPSFL